MSTEDQRSLVIAAGGTGGHLFPAEALAQELNRRGWRIYLMTDERANQYGVTFPCEEIIEIPSATISPRAPIRALIGIAKIVRGFAKAYRRLGRLKVEAVVGFGGYPTLPPLLAAMARGIATCIHEQNAVIGRANRMVAGRVDLIASTFPEPRRLPQAARGKLRVTGNPVRDAVLARRGVEFRAPAPGDPVRLLVFGGSQGARIFSDVVPPALALLGGDIRSRLIVTQQCREEDMDRVKSAYRAADISAEVEPFFRDLPERMAKAHLIISRSGASTLCELGVIGRPAVLVPLPHSLEGDQLHNAQAFEKVGGGWLMEQGSFTPQMLADRLNHLFATPAELAEAAHRAAGFGKPDAAKDLADLLESLGRMRISGSEEISIGQSTGADNNETNAAGGGDTIFEGRA